MIGMNTFSNSPPCESNDRSVFDLLIRQSQVGKISESFILKNFGDFYKEKSNTV